MLPRSKMFQIFIAICLVTSTTYFFIIRRINNLNHDSHVLKVNLKETERKKTCSNQTVPSLIIQYGGQRTATTLQFQILCLIMAILHENEINSVGCYYSRSFKQMVYKYSVIKTHVLQDFVMDLPSDTWVFLTSSNRLKLERKLNFDYSKRKIIERRIKIPFIADIRMVFKLGYLIVYEYQCIFGLSDKQMEYLVEYLRYWQILRVCCGVQMSSDWRNRLSPDSNYTQHHNIHSPAYPACEIYNISQVENLMRKTYMFEKFSPIISLHHIIGKPSTSDGELNGTYCERCQANISKNNLHFNVPCT